MKRLFYVWLFLAVALASIAACPPASADVPWGSVCRVTSVGGIGSGVCFYEADGYSYFLTNHHVLAVNENSTVADATPKIECWTQGHASGAVESETVSSHPGYDVAVVRTKTEGWPARPGVVPLVADVSPGAGVIVIGCPEGQWPTAYQGHRLAENPTGRIPFFPAPKQGRSGGPILNIDGTGVVGLVQYQDDLGPGDMRGRAIPSHIIVRVLNGDDPGGRFALTQCGPEGCPVPSYGNNYPPPSRMFGIGNEYNYTPPQQQPQQSPAPIYPTLPPPETLPVPSGGSSIDLEPIRAWLAQNDQATAANATAIGELTPRVERIESDLGIIVGSAGDAEQTALSAQTAANAAIQAAEEATAKADETPGLIEQATETAKAGAFTMVKGWLIGGVQKFGPWGIGLAVLIGWILYKKLKGMIDANGDGKISKEEWNEFVRGILDRNGDGVVNAKDLLHLGTMGRFGK